MTRFQARVERDGRFWFVQVDGIGATQARHPSELDAMVMDLIHIRLGDLRDDIEVDYTIER